MAFVCPAYENNSEPPCCACCSAAKEEQRHQPHEPELPEIMICFKEHDRGNQQRQCDKLNNRHHDETEAFHKLSQSKSRELRGSILYTGCDCLKRDGLQHDCRRTGCHGSPECVVHPPTCKPSQIVEERNRLRESIRARNANKTKNVKNNQKGDNNGHAPRANYRCYPAILKSPTPCCKEMCPACFN